MGVMAEGCFDDGQCGFKSHPLLLLLLGGRGRLQMDGACSDRVGEYTMSMIPWWGSRSRYELPLTSPCNRTWSGVGVVRVLQ